MTDIDDAIERAEWAAVESHRAEAEEFPGGLSWQIVEYADAARILAAEVKRLRRFIPPDGWVQFGTHANCGRRVPLEFSEDVGEDGLPLWERVVVRREGCTCEECQAGHA